MFGHKNGRGVILLDGKQIGETLQCVHCGKHWQVIPGSGASRGWCHLCFGPCCGADNCMVCVPFEAKLEAQEAMEANNQEALNKLTSKYPDAILLNL